jgi:ABC-type nitrate/sulfonate/bicarbonate transport system permease component
MSNRFTTIRRHDGDPSPGLDLSRVIVIGFLIAAALGVLTGLGWMGYQFLRAHFGG